MKNIIGLILLYTPLVVFCQNLTGTWEGSGGGVSYIKMVIRHSGDSVYGYTYDEGDGFCKATFFGIYKRPHKKLVGNGVRMISRTPNHVLVDYDLKYSKEPGGEYLRENLGEAGFLERLFGQRSSQYLKKTSNKVDFKRIPAATKKLTPVIIPPDVKEPEKKVPPVVKKEPVKKTPRVDAKTGPVIIPSGTPEKKKEKPLDIILKKSESIPAPATTVKKKDERSSKLVQTIYTSADTVKMFVYDNGEVDGDTVTVFFDNSIILNRYRISDKAKELSLPVSRAGKQHTIELFANNLGSIPPNTALIIIIANKKRYELRASYDLQTNAKIIIQYQE